MQRSTSILMLVLVLATGALIIQPARSDAAPASEDPNRALTATNECWRDQINAVYVPETGHHIFEPFLTTWRQYGLALVGYPISEPLERDGMTVQYFERARFEHHSELEGTPHEVLLTLLGQRVAGNHDNPAAFAPVQPDTPQADPYARYYPETGHYLPAPFREFWDTYGGLPLFGYPISEVFVEDGRLAQYFERARFEHHPEYAGTRYEIQLGHLGRAAAAADGINEQAVARADNIPDYNWSPEPRAHRIPALMYHQFGYPASRYQVTYWDFEQQLIWLRDNGYVPVTMSEVYAAIYGGASLPDKPFLITFDDGSASQWGAVEILERYGYPGTFFVHPDSALTPDQLRELVARGHEIGSHSNTHPFLTNVSDEQLWHEVSGSRAALSNMLGVPVNYFAYPFGDWNSRVISAVQAAGYCGAVHAWDGSMWTPEKRWQQPRIEISGHLTIAGFARLISGNLSHVGQTFAK